MEIFTGRFLPQAASLILKGNRKRCHDIIMDKRKTNR